MDVVQVIAQLLLDCAIVSGATFLSGILVLPSLAGREVHAQMTDVAEGISRSIAGYRPAPHICTPHALAAAAAPVGIWAQSSCLETCRVLL